MPEREQKKRFSKARAIHYRLQTAPDTMTIPEVMFYTGAAKRTVRDWVSEWKATGMIARGIAVQLAGPGSFWSVNRAVFVAWLIARKGVNLSPEYGFPSIEEAEMIVSGETIEK
jgi:hypothetical protein